MSQFTQPQVWPLDDTFADGATAYGTGVRRYLRVKPWAATLTDYNLVPAAEGGEPRLIGTSTSDDYPDLGDTNYGAAFLQYGPFAGIAGNQVSGFVERETYQADAEVTMLPGMAVYLGAADYEAFHCVGVCGRVSGGTLTTPAGSTAVNEYHSVPDGYYFMQVKKATRDPSLVLYKVSSGTVTVLEDSPLSDFEEFTPGVADGGVPRQMRMVITGTSSTRIRCFRRIFDSGPILQGGGLTRQEVEVFDHTDSSSPISSAGRWGAVGAGPVSYTNLRGDTTEVATIVKSLRIRNATGTELYLRDFFRRTMTSLRHVDEDLHGGIHTFGFYSRSLAQAYSGDMLGAPSSGLNYSHYAHLIADAGNDRLVLGVDPTTAYTGDQQRYGWYFSQCPANSPQQHKKIAATFLSTATSPRETRALGIHLRASVNGQALLRGDVSEDDIESSNRTGYRSYVEYEHVSGTTDTFTLKVYHHDGSTAGNYEATLIATADLSLTLGTAFTFAVECRNFDTDELGQGGDVALKFYIDGSAVTPSAESIDGLTVEDDWLFDRRSTASKTGLMFGMYAMVETFNSSGLMYVDSFTDEALSNPPSDDTGIDQPTIALDAETAGKTGTLEVPLSWPVTEVHDFQTNDTEFDTGHRQTLPIFAKKRRAWEVQALGAELSERESLLEFFEAHKGTEIPFDWTYTVTGETVPVRFAEATFASKMRSAVGAGAEDFRFNLVEVFDASTFNP